MAPPNYNQARFISILDMAQLKYRQDLPPKGGYAGIKWEKNLPTRGISGVAMFLLCSGVMAVGFTLLIRHQRKRRLMQLFYVV